MTVLPGACNFTLRRVGASQAAERKAGVLPVVGFSGRLENTTCTLHRDSGPSVLYFFFVIRVSGGVYFVSFLTIVLCQGTTETFKIVSKLC